MKDVSPDALAGRFVRRYFGLPVGPTAPNAEESLHWMLEDMIKAERKACARAAERAVMPYFKGESLRVARKAIRLTILERNRKRR